MSNMMHDGTPEWAAVGNTVYIRSSRGVSKVLKATVVRRTKTQVVAEYKFEGRPATQRRFKVDNWNQDMLREMGDSYSSFYSKDDLVSQSRGEELLAQEAEEKRRNEIITSAKLAAGKVAGGRHNHQPDVEDMREAINAMQRAIHEFAEEQAQRKADHEKWQREFDERTRREAEERERGPAIPVQVQQTPINTRNLGERKGRKF